jgi:FMN phosphatase YigB (HAD superfamily)
MRLNGQKTLVLDLGDVVFNWAPPKDGKISPGELKRVMTSLQWHQFERGQISEAQCYEQAGQVLSLNPSDIADTIQQAKLSLRCDERLVSFLRELKKEPGNPCKIYAMSNISKEYYKIIRDQPWEWELFDDIFISGNLGTRKPALRFYEHVLEAIGHENYPENVLFVDDKRENVLSALSLGMQAFRFEDCEKTIQGIRSFLGDPVERGRQFLRDNAKNMSSTTDSGLVLKENFAQLLILEATGNRYLMTCRFGR